MPTTVPLDANSPALSRSAKSQPGFLVRKSRRDLLGYRERDWRYYIECYAPLLPNSGQVISIADQYFLSLGAHSSHRTMLMDRASPEPLTVEKSLAVAALVTFAIDAPTVPMHSETLRGQESPNIAMFQRSLRSAGIPSTEDYFRAVAAAASGAQMFAESVFPHGSILDRIAPDPEETHWAYLSWPQSSSTWRALTAYWSGTLSVSVPARILNYCRAIEAVMPRHERAAMFSKLSSTRALPVWTRIRTSSCDDARGNAAARVRGRALARQRSLIGIHGSPDRALDWLYCERRGKAAHADKSSLDFEGLASFADQLGDSMLFQYMARVAIEAKWS